MSKKSDAFRKMIQDGSLKKAVGPSDNSGKKMFGKKSSDKELKFGKKK